MSQDDQNKTAIFLDFAAATPMSPSVIEAMKPYYAESFYNPSATYLAARNVKKDIAQAREHIALGLGCRPAEIVFTAGVTESINLAIQGVMKKYPNTHVLVGSTEHVAVIDTANQYSPGLISVRANGTVDIAAFDAQITDDTVLVSLMYANNETGVIHPVKDVYAVIEKHRKQRQKNGNNTPLLFHSDAAQATNFLDLHVSRLGVDLLSLNGAKMYGPKQTGILYVRGGSEIQPIIHGGGQERGLRGGTENVAGIVGLSKAFVETQAIRKQESQRLKKLQADFERSLLSQIPQSQVNGAGSDRLPSISNVTIPGIDGERFVQEMDERGFMIATGAACHADSGEPSHVLLAMGKDRQQAQASLRISFGRQTTSEQLSSALKNIVELTTNSLI